MTFTTDWSAKAPPSWVMRRVIEKRTLFLSATFDFAPRVFTGIPGLEVRDEEVGAP